MFSVASAIAFDVENVALQRSLVCGHAPRVRKNSIGSHSIFIALTLIELKLLANDSPNFL